MHLKNRESSLNQYFEEFLLLQTILFSVQTVNKFVPMKFISIEQFTYLFDSITILYELIYIL